MKSKSYNRTIIVSLLMVTITVGAMLWPTTGRSQSSSRRERSRRDTSSRFSPSRSERAPQRASEQQVAAAKPVEPNVAAAEKAAPNTDETGQSVASDTEEDTGPWAKYRIILRRNIFSRQRTAYRPRDRSSVMQAVAAPNPETHFVLRGITQEDNQLLAFVEDTQDGGVLRLRQGDRVARGAIKTLSLDTLEYQLEDKTISIRLGYDLEGTRAPVVMAMDEVSIVPQTPTPAATPAPASTAAPAGPQTQTQVQPKAPVPAGNEADIIKRLMEQRRQQGGQ